MWKWLVLTTKESNRYVEFVCNVHDQKYVRFGDIANTTHAANLSL